MADTLPHGGRSDSDLDPPPSPPSPWEVQFVEVVRTTFGSNLAPKAPSFFFFGIWRVLKNHLKERLFDPAQARASYTPPFWGSFA